MRLVQITWRDHSADKASAGWEKLTDLSAKEEVIAHSVGWIVKEDENHIVLASAISDEYGASVQIVLKGAINQIADLVPTAKFGREQ